MKSLVDSKSTDLDRKLIELVTNKVVGVYGPKPLEEEVAVDTIVRFNKDRENCNIRYINTASTYDEFRVQTNTDIILLRPDPIYLKLKGIFGVKPLTGMVGVVDILKFNPKQVYIMGMNCYEEQYDELGKDTKAIHNMTFDQQVTVWKGISLLYPQLVILGELSKLIDSLTDYQPFLKASVRNRKGAIL